MRESKTRKSSFLLVCPWELGLAGGVTIVVRNLAKTMMERGFMEPLIAINSWDDSSPTVLRDNFRFRFSIFGQISALGLFKAMAVAPLRLWQTFCLLQEYKVQAVNFHFPGVAPFGVAVLKRVGAFR